MAYDVAEGSALIMAASAIGAGIAMISGFGTGIGQRATRPVKARKR